MKNSLLFILKAISITKTRYLSFCHDFFGNVEKMAWLERQGYFQNLWHHNLVNKQ